MKSYLFSTLLFLLVSTVGVCQSIDYDIKFKHITEKSGLCSNETTFSFQDSDGFIWVCTYGGISRYDGSNFKHFIPSETDSTTIETSLIQGAAEDKNGDIWFATIGKGIVRYDKESEVFTHFSSENSAIKNNVILSITTDNHGDIYFCQKTNEFGHVAIKSDKSVQITSYLLPEKKNIKCKAIKPWHENEIWIATTVGLYLFDTNTKKLTKVDTNNAILALVKNGANEFFYSDVDGHIFWIENTINNDYKTHKLRVDSSSANLNAKEQLCFTFSSNNEIIGGWTNSGIFTAHLDLQNKSIHIHRVYQMDLTDNHSISSNSIVSISLDRTNIAWIVSGNSGLMRFDLEKKQFTHIKHGIKNGELQASNIYYLYEDARENLWVSVKSSNLHFLPKDSAYNNFQYFSQKDGITGAMLSSICETGKGDEYSLWFATWYTYQLKNYNPELDLKPNFIRHVHSKKENVFQKGAYMVIKPTLNGDVFYGHYSHGLTHFTLDSNQTPTVQHIYKNDPADPTSIIGNTVRAIQQTKDKNLWIGTSTGLSKIIRQGNNISFLNYTKGKKDSTSLPHNSILTMYEDKSGVLWLGSLGGGLIRTYRNTEGNITHFKGYTRDNGLVNNIVKGILEDKQGDLWVSSGGGLSKFNPTTEEVKNYTEEDGLQGNNFRDNSCVKRRNGQFLFGGLNGINVFYPDSIHDNPHTPLIALTSFKVHGESVTPNQDFNGHTVLNKSIVNADTLVITHKQSTIEFGFAALHFAIPKKNKLAYKLKGFDKKWIYTNSTKPYANYTNLDGGTYTFIVKGWNNDGLETENPRTITLIVLPPWWKTIWFKVVILLLTISSFIAFYIYRTRAIKAENERLERLVNQRTEKLKSTNEALSERQEEILTQNEEITQQNEEISQQAEELKVINEDMAQQAKELKNTNKELEQQKKTLETSYRNIENLGAFGQSITSELNLDHINTIVNNYIQHFIDVQAIGLGLVSEKKKQVVFQNFVQQNQKLAPFACSFEEQNNLIAECILSQKDIRSNNLLADHALLLAHSPEINQQSLPASIVYLPLILSGNCLGILVLHHATNKGFNDQEFNIIKNLASYLTIAISNAKSYEIITRKNTDISNSINYAQTIQQAILPLGKEIESQFHYFSIFKPKDIVSGDFYWYTVVQRPAQPPVYLMAVIDCTGHGVPGAIMSIVSNGALNRIVKERGIIEPAQILDTLDTEIRTNLKQEQTDNSDGMDVCLCSFVKTTNNQLEVEFSASKRPLIIYRNQTQTLHIQKGTSRYIGGNRSKSRLPFETHNFTLNPLDVIYMSSDGYVDQNNPKRVRYGSKRLFELLTKIGPQNLQEQKEILELEFDQHRDGEPQRDDITFVGLRMR